MSRWSGRAAPPKTNTLQRHREGHNLDAAVTAEREVALWEARQVDKARAQSGVRTLAVRPLREPDLLQTGSARVGSTTSLLLPQFTPHGPASSRLKALFCDTSTEVHGRSAGSFGACCGQERVGKAKVRWA